MIVFTSPLRCSLINNFVADIAPSDFQLTEFVLPASATVVAALPDPIDFETPTDVAFIKFPKTKKPCPKVQ